MRRRTKTVGLSGLASLPLILALAAVSLPVPAWAGKEESPLLAPAGRSPGNFGIPQPGAVAPIVAQDQRRPGAPPPAPPRVAPITDPGAVPPPSPVLPREFIPIPDRWRLIEAIGVNERWWDPYNQNTLKGDRPLWDDWFINLSAISDTVYEPRRTPIPVGISTTRRANSVDLFGDTNQNVFVETVILSASLIKGDTAYRPPDYEFRITPVIQYNRAEVEERGVLFADPNQGTVRSDNMIAFQEGFIDYHLRNVSDRYDFDSIRIGIQPFSSDFRGFVFQDIQLGARLFGNRSNNLYQYNLAWFRRLEKDTNSGLNDIGQPLRKDDIYIANVYAQDFPVVGFTSQATYMYNVNDESEDFYYDKNFFLQRPATIGDQRPRKYDVHYLGLNGDGHFGRLNLTGSAYYAFGTDDHNQFSGIDKSDIRAYFAAIEPSIDFDWIRVRASALVASGDKDPFDNREEGFDAIFENPQFAGADTSYWIRQSIPFIGGGGVALSPRNGVLPSLRPSKEIGQSNFNNPGIRLLGFGTDMDVTPELRLSTNFNKLEFMDTSSLEFLRNQADIHHDIGYDLSVAAIYRPLFMQNIVFRLSGAVLVPSDGLRDLYETSRSQDLFYSVLANLILTY